MQVPQCHWGERQPTWKVSLSQMSLVTVEDTLYGQVKTGFLESKSCTFIFCRNKYFCESPNPIHIRLHASNELRNLCRFSWIFFWTFKKSYFKKRIWYFNTVKTRDKILTDALSLWLFHPVNNKESFIFTITCVCMCMYFIQRSYTILNHLILMCVCMHVNIYIYIYIYIYLYYYDCHRFFVCTSIIDKVPWTYLKYCRFTWIVLKSQSTQGIIAKFVSLCWLNTS